MNAVPEKLWPVLVDLADRLLPAEGEMPAAGQVLERGDVGAVVEELPDLPAQVERALAAVAESPAEERLAVLAADDPEGLTAIGEFVAAVYFLDREVSRLVGYRRREAVPIVVETDLAELAAPVVALGFSSPVEG